MISFPAGMAIERPAHSGFRLDPSDVHIWAIPLDGPSVLADGGSLSSEERRRSERILREDQRRRFVAGRTALRHILGGYLDLPAADVPLEAAPGGKPRLTAADNRRDLRFNLTHSGSCAVLAVAVGVEVGVDVESVRPIRAFDMMLARCLAPVEREAILHHPVASRDREFLRYWTHKEAYLKAVGTGLRRPLPSIIVDLAASPYWRLFDHSGIDDPTESWLVEMEPAGDMVGAVAWLDGSRRGIEVFSWEPRISTAAPPATTPTPPPADRPTARAPAEPLSDEEVRDWLADYLAKHLGVASSTIDVTASFDSFALDSAVAIEMTGDLERLLDRPVDPMLVYDYPTIEKFAEHLATRP